MLTRGATEVPLLACPAVFECDTLVAQPREKCRIVTVQQLDYSIHKVEIGKALLDKPAVAPSLRRSLDLRHFPFDALPPAIARDEGDDAPEDDEPKPARPARRPRRVKSADDSEGAAA